MALANTLAYHDSATITGVKGFIVQALIATPFKRLARQLELGDLYLLILKLATIASRAGSYKAFYNNPTIILKNLESKLKKNF